MLVIMLKFGMRVVDPHFSYNINISAYKRLFFIAGFTKCHTLLPINWKCLCILVLLTYLNMYKINALYCFHYVGSSLQIACPELKMLLLWNKVLLRVTSCLYTYWNTRWFKPVEMPDSNQMFGNSSGDTPDIS